MIKVNPFGVVIEIILKDDEWDGTFYVVMVNDFVTYKTFGNYDLDPYPFLVMDDSMKLLSDENEELFMKIEEVLDQMVIQEKEKLG
jgi:hypothetical protein